jgi:hypothetical protein
VSRLFPAQARCLLPKHRSTAKGPEHATGPDVNMSPTNFATVCCIANESSVVNYKRCDGLSRGDMPHLQTCVMWLA